MKNTVELIGIYGGDETHALSAWTSTSRELTPLKRERIPFLLKLLAQGSDGNSHGTPFEKSSIHFLVTTDIATHIHLLKHRVGVSINGESARYKEIKEDKYYIPTDWPAKWTEALDDYTKVGLSLYHECLKDLVNSGMDKKRAKESARFFRTYNTQITADVMFNFRSFIHFLKLRSAPSAQKEIRELADVMLKQVQASNQFVHSLKAFGYE